LRIIPPGKNAEEEEEEEEDYLNMINVKHPVFGEYSSLSTKFRRVMVLESYHPPKKIIA
jgi:hypothetical protein